MIWSLVEYRGLHPQFGYCGTLDRCSGIAKPLATAEQHAALVFERKPHTYTVSGRIWPSVTQVLEDVGIIDYSFIPSVSRELYLRRGSAVHLATEYDDLGDLDEAALEPMLVPYLSAWRAFRRDARDVSATTLCDLKTTAAPWWVKLQLAAYCNFFHSPRTFRRMAVELHADGTYGVHEYPCSETQRDFQVFLGALTVWQEKRRYSNERRAA